ncbi:hypothetical protein SAMN05216474_3102 [Lishizhenia tianjinensis]|uniref:Uncharacterized protein n=2 Tax=Lishizhenia tianjinensis TaxID=477690 RepID=A0A1I7BUW3_9FLAO|nr:hypothetical protein SAMN05216474_3102 [Lishizhenia tianjinensis]
MNLDRPKISSEEIRNRQNFDQILGNLKALHKPFYKKTWFWGTTGLATVAVAIGLSTLITNENNLDENNTTLASTTALAPLSEADNLEDTPCIQTPVDGQDVPYETFKVLPGKDTTISTANGSTISFKAATLMAPDNTSAVDVKVRYFADKASAFVAGIPMTVEEGAFESAGMLEVRGTQNGEEVGINPKAPLAIDMQMYKPSEGFNFYYLNEDNGGWEDSKCVYSDASSKERKTDAEPVAKSQKVTLEKELAPQEKIEIQERIAEIDVELVELKKQEPQRADYKLVENQNLVFDLDYDVKEFPELEKLQGVGFEALPNQKQYSDIVKENWDNVKLQLLEEGQYKITFIKGRKTNYLIARPVLSGNDEKEAEELFNMVMSDIKERKEELVLEKKALEKRQEDVQLQMKKLIEEQKAARLKDMELRKAMFEAQQQTMAMGNAIYKATASFEAFQWGVYNCDSPRKFPNPAPLAFNYYSDGDNMQVQKAYVFSFSKEARFEYTAGYFGLQSLEKIGFHHGKNVIFVQDKNGKLAYASFSESDLPKEGVHNFKLTSILNADFTAENIKAILGEKTPSTDNVALR